MNEIKKELEEKKEDSKESLVGLSLPALEKELSSLPAYRCKQLYEALYVQGVRDFSSLTIFPKDLRVLLEKKYTLRSFKLSDVQSSMDGTQKWLFKMPDGQEIETVHIPEKTRGTLCISSQVGCTLTCKFCHTGTQTLVRNLTAGEILTQIMMAQDFFEDWKQSKNSRYVTNIVFMGMGEPLYNYNSVSEAMKIAIDPKGLGFSNRKITLSTSGVVPFIEKCGQELGVNLAISLHAPTNELRSKIVPLNKKYPLEELIDACHAYPGVHKYRKITFEYVMLKGVNDSPSQARALIKLLEGLPAKINLIPFNSWPGAKYECSSIDAQNKFSNILSKAGIYTFVRRARGDDILAACGQLKSKSERERRARH